MRVVGIAGSVQWLDLVCFGEAGGFMPYRPGVAAVWIQATREAKIGSGPQIRQWNITRRRERAITVRHQGLESNNQSEDRAEQVPPGGDSRSPATRLRRRERLYFALQSRVAIRAKCKFFHLLAIAPHFIRASSDEVSFAIVILQSCNSPGHPYFHALSGLAVLTTMHETCWSISKIGS